MTFKNWLISTGRKPISAKKYESAVYGSISGWAEEAGIVKSNLIDVNDPEEFESLSNRIKELEIFLERNTDGHQMYSAALNRYSEYLIAIQNEIEEDIDKVSNDDSVSETEKDSLIKSRLGQGVFRKSLMDYWQRCAVTGYQSSKLLVASHIKPWRSSDNKERMDVFNGLLLIPNLDKAFDKGFISFKKNGSIIISEFFQKPASLGIKSDLNLKISNRHQPYLEYHRDIVFLQAN
ncbi:MAG: HNH endonuclease [Candidatus Marinimicrobia bacterium]|nr:HNH endonuclease [Candidatus Neomarinimicrobiota bacterium]MCF7827785.1 HNH endonuclease [Candidatus Neomarinimicrobiota bacterium]MCF7879460.1 HNH endonuclease [Candidatus Neomarinimicrobiota bacterium]